MMKTGQVDGVVVRLRAYGKVIPNIIAVKEPVTYPIFAFANSK